jgi:hypothetical protein
VIEQVSSDPRWKLASPASLSWQPRTYAHASCRSITITDVT